MPLHGYLKKKIATPIVMMTTLHSHLNTRQHLEHLSVKMVIFDTRQILNSEFTYMF